MVIYNNVVSKSIRFPPPFIGPFEAANRKSNDMTAYGKNSNYAVENSSSIK